MQFLKDLNAFHIDGKEIPCIAASGPPDHRCPGAPGVLYMDTDTGSLYICMDADTIEKKYAWRIVGDVDAASVQQAVEAYLEENPVSGGSVSADAAGLLIAILQNAVFITNQTGNISALQAALVSGGSSGGNDSEMPDEPAVTDGISVTDGVMTIISVGSAVSAADGVMTIA